MHLKWILFQMYLNYHWNISANDTYVDPESFVRGGGGEGSNCDVFGGFF